MADGRFPGAGARRGKNDDRSGCLEDFLAALEYPLGELGEFGAAMVDDRHVHGAEHAIRHRARARNLQKMASLVLGHGFLVRYWSLLPTILHSFLPASTNKLFTFFQSTASPSKAY